MNFLNLVFGSGFVIFLLMIADKHRRSSEQHANTQVNAPVPTYLDRSLINITSLTEGTCDGHHAWVRQWVRLNINDLDNPETLPWVSGSVRTELIALGVYEKMLPLIMPTIRHHFSGNSEAHQVLLFQRTGNFPLGIIVCKRGETLILKSEEAKLLVEEAAYVAIMTVH